MSILDEIVAIRRARIEREGPSLGRPVPAERTAPLVPFGQDPFVICEVKRRSPSRGEISAGLDAPAQASRYASQGARTVSVLTEEDHFSGALSDLMAIKAASPGLCVLRKDFLLSVEDVEISYRAGADVVLLIAAILDESTLRAMYSRATELGLAALVEVHSEAEVERAAAVEPHFTGINARDLGDFTVDPILPLRLRARIEWPTRLVFESGIRSREEAAFAAGAGFDGILVGEAAVRSPELIGELIAGLADGRGDGARRPGPPGQPSQARPVPAARRARPAAPVDRSQAAAGPGPGRRDFWRRLYGHAAPGRPLVKVCGLTNADDARLADELGADLLGFIFAPSKRRAEPAVVRRIGETRAQKVGVVVVEPGRPRLDDEIVALLESGVISAIQFHGDEGPEECFQLAFPYYKAVQLRREDDCVRMDAYRCPRVLIDAHVDGMRGGTGRRLSGPIVFEAKKHRPLWLAGGIGADNVFDVLRSYGPELVDASSALETSPGHKDPDRMRRFFAEIERATRGG